MLKRNQDRKELTIGSFDDDNIKSLLYTSTLFTSVVRQMDDNVILRFRGGYISPALAVPLMAIRDELKLSGYTISFSIKDMKEIHEMAEFFVHSGIHTTMNSEAIALIEPILEKMNIPKQSIWTTEAHRISLSEIRSGEREKNQLISDIFNLLLPVYIDRSESDIYKSMVSSMMELYGNALSHGEGQYIYSMAKKARDGDNLIVVFDNGKGIPGAYREYIESLPTEKSKEKQDKEIIEWAFRKGTSTKQAEEGIPRGLGLPTLAETISKYKGELGIASGEGICYSEKGIMKYETADSGIKGTLLILKVPSTGRE